MLTPNQQSRIQTAEGNADDAVWMLSDKETVALPGVQRALSHLQAASDELNCVVMEDGDPSSKKEAALRMVRSIAREDAAGR